MSLTVMWLFFTVFCLKRSKLRESFSVDSNFVASRCRTLYILCSRNHVHRKWMIYANRGQNSERSSTIRNNEANETFPRKIYYLKKMLFKRMYDPYSYLNNNYDNHVLRQCITIRPRMSRYTQRTVFSHTVV